MNNFEYISGNLFCEDVDLLSIANEYGTPAYVYSKDAIIKNSKSYVDSFKDSTSLACFAVKSLSNLSILKIIKDSGCGFDIVSGGELQRVLSVGADPQKIIFSGVGKSEEEIKEAIENKILSFNVESVSELYKIENIAKELDSIASISIRINPDIDSGGHDYITTGRKGDKFGISSTEDILSLCKHASSSSNLKLVGLACHIGSQIMSLYGYEKSANKVFELADKLLELGISLEFLDMGGGLGVSYENENPPSPKELIGLLENKFLERNERLILEPGRSISANTGVLLTKVEFIKENFLIVDAAMNDLLRPALYKAVHTVSNLKGNKKNLKRWNVVGPVCESSDFLAKNVELEAIEGDILAIRNVGAYGFVMASNYNSRLRPCEILIDGDKTKIVRKRESMDDLLALERFKDD
ncbi:MAG: diaminopimelate decarboxylase [Proteobacteria bacterium]|uniref:Diaminopimelate decarboxylase n=1 Tax=SAR86 cluster bacterium TaxID=2030880 RepID=A0A937IGG0_9GAMM|nr:diaminopimelate decarboxylase [SAR86 cluster bacterium]MDA0775110.1 diaminopimelate decarboxylase [Pseudomonadota bacterium]MDA0975892.1 diaminopimelate decarboxylase [Pseudomonadota bacterium]MDA1037459.1 diaminopimelate decarboxylase [Pseudomonadota bacterium]